MLRLRFLYRFKLWKNAFLLEKTNHGGFCLSIVTFDIAAAKDAEALASSLRSFRFVWIVMVYVPPCFVSTYITLNANNSKSFLHFIIGSFLISTQYKHTFASKLFDVSLHDNIDEFFIQFNAIADTVRLLASHER